MDERIRKLAKNLLEYSVKLHEDEKILIEYSGERTIPLVKELVRKSFELKAIPYTKNIDMTLKREMLLGATKEQIELLAKVDSEMMKQMDCYLRIDAEDNPCELSDVPSEKLNMVYFRVSFSNIC